MTSASAVRWYRFSLLAAALLLAPACTGDTGPTGPAGPAGDPGGQGDPGDDGDDGNDGVDGNDGRGTWLVGPGLKLEVMSAAINGTTAEVTYKITDGGGTPLDLDGLFTQGAVSPRFVLARLDGTTNQYVSYRTNAAGQAAADSGGSTVEVGVGEGVYTYTFGTSITVPDATETQTIAVYATRDYEDQRYVANTTFDFLVGGGTVTNTRDIVTTAACNQCHTKLEAHGGSRREVGVCITCHSPQTVDPDTGNTVDFAVMIHKIHRGATLPSVVGGTPYQIIGFNNSVHDYSTVVFPHDIRSCETCHTGTQGSKWRTNPNPAACGSCHDDVNFVTGVNHPGGTNDTCSNCHVQTGSVTAIVDAHFYPYNNPANALVELSIDAIRNGGPGQQPQVDLTVTVDGVGRDIVASPLNALTATIAGPNSDYTTYWQANLRTEGTLTPIDAAAGRFTYTFPAGKAMPAGATGSYTMGLEGYLQPAGADRQSAYNPVQAFAVTDATAVPRRQIVDGAACNNCHQDLGMHGGARKNPNYCVMCHNPTNTNDQRSPRVEPSVIDVESVDMKVFIHKIHRGEDLEQPYFLGGFQSPQTAEGNMIDFGHVRFPGDLRACGTCHTGSSHALPLAASVLPTRLETLTCIDTDGDGFCQNRTSVERFLPPVTAVCTSCHDGDSTVAHAQIMTTMAGVESCLTCHGPGSAFDPARAHRLDP